MTDRERVLEELQRINPRSGHMSSARATSNKATLARFHEALSSGDWALISKTIDEVVQPDALIRTPLPIAATGAKLLKAVFGRLRRLERPRARNVPVQRLGPHGRSGHHPRPEEEGRMGL